MISKWVGKWICGLALGNLLVNRRFMGQEMSKTGRPIGQWSQV